MLGGFPNLWTRAVQPMGCATGDLCGHSQLSGFFGLFAFSFFGRVNGFGLAHTVLPALASTTPVLPFEEGLSALQTVSTQWFTTTETDCWWAGFFRGDLHSRGWGRGLIVQRDGQGCGGSAQGGADWGGRLGCGIRG